MSKKSILTAKQALKLQPDDYVFVNAGGGLRRMKVRGLEKLLRVPIPDVMYDFRSGDNSAADRETAKDLSGNGNDATIMNCAFNGTGSGYGGGGLQLDGVDDYVKMPETLKGLKTVFLEARTQELPATLYDQRTVNTDRSYAIYAPAATSNSPSYRDTNLDGKTYINGQLNHEGGAGAGAAWKSKDLLGLRHLITATNDKATGVPVIGSNCTRGIFSKMTVYRFLGYKRLLTAEEIAEVIGAYGLLEECEGVNLLKGTATFDPAYIDHNYSGSAVWSINGKHAGLDVQTTTFTDTTSFRGFKSDVLSPTHFPTIISFYGRVTTPDPSGKVVKFACYTGRNQDGNAKAMDGGSDWKQYFLYAENGFDFSDAETDRTGNGFVEFSSAVATIEICGLKVERANPDLMTPTPWTPAFGENFPEGFDAGQLEEADDPGAGDTDFDPSLADAWILSGRTNEEAPEAIAGEKGFSLSCQNFAWTAESGFDGQGFLVFDGVDDRLMSREDFGKALTVILSFRNLEKPKEWSMAMSLRSADGQKSISGSYYETGFGGNTSTGMSGCGLYRRPYSEEEETTDIWMNEEGFCGKGWTNQTSQSQKPDDLSTFAVGCAYNLAQHRKCAVRFFALYRESLSDEKCRSQLAYLTRLWESRKV